MLKCIKYENVFWREPGVIIGSLFDVIWYRETEIGLICSTTKVDFQKQAEIFCEKLFSKFNLFIR